MARPKPLPDSIINEELKRLKIWKRDGSIIIRELVTPDFASAIGLINTIALHAEKLDHHPDILLYGWNKVRVTLSTHDVGALTELDFKLANLIESISLNLNKD